MEKQKILVIDDSLEIRHLLKRLLEKHGFLFEGAANGVDGLLKLEKKGPFVLVLADLNMPLMDGLAFLDKVRVHEKFSSTPVIVFSSDGSSEKIKMAKDKGARGWLVKTYEPQKILDVIQKVVS